MVAATSKQLHAWRCAAIDAIATTIASAPDGLVPAYPGWTNRDLAVHVVRIYDSARVAAMSGSLDRPQPEFTVTPDDAPDSLADAVREAHVTAEQALEACDAATVWTPVGQRSAYFWERRLLREAVLHRFDAEQAAGAPGSPDAGAALELIDEFLDTDVPRAFARGTRPNGAVTIQADDARWQVDLSAGVVVRDPDGTVAATIGGNAASLWLWLVRRKPLPGVVTIDDPDGSVAVFSQVIDDFDRPSR